MDSLRRMPVHVLIMLTMLFGLEMTFSGNQAWLDRASCDQIKMACKNAGFVLGGGAREGLLLACFPADRPGHAPAEVGVAASAVRKPTSGERMSNGKRLGSRSGAGERATGARRRRSDGL